MTTLAVESSFQAWIFERAECTLADLEEGRRNLVRMELSPVGRFWASQGGKAAQALYPDIYRAWQRVEEAQKQGDLIGLKAALFGLRLYAGGI